MCLNVLEVSAERQHEEGRSEEDGGTGVRASIDGGRERGAEGGTGREREKERGRGQGHQGRAFVGRIQKESRYLCSTSAEHGSVGNLNASKDAAAFRLKVGRELKRVSSNLLILDPFTSIFDSRQFRNLVEATFRGSDQNIGTGRFRTGPDIIASNDALQRNQSLWLIHEELEPRSSRMGACGTNHEPGSGSAFINYYLSLYQNLGHLYLEYIQKSLFN
ncbi:hypothetical protein DBV15_08592 [Temnothorax longispinosus]|uniref:Uncharacterized protein n=1 Tax=Temnothorax longispinosus TaxID=300112 RepID=A0A4S2KUT7_9HYME|nr:hypothetical protein DBV15_08592 [Temnothorax longispinosus]